MWLVGEASDEVATGELTDDSNINIMTRYQSAIKRYGDQCSYTILDKCCSSGFLEGK